jgi:ABC-2 type transport system permease protein
MKTIFWQELKISRKSLLLWLVGMAMLAGMGSGEYSVVVGSGEAVTIGIAAMPKVARIMFGIYDSIPINTPLGYYICMFLWYCAIAYTHAAYVGATIISKEESNKTAEYIFTKPFPRSKIISAKILAATISVAAMTIVTWGITVLTMVPQMNGVDISKEIAFTMIGMFLTQIIFMAIGLFFSAVCRNQSSALRFSILSVVIFYFISVVVEYIGNTALTVLSPFWYFNAPALVSSGFNVLYLVLALLICMSCIYWTYKLYKKRDLYC